MRPSPVKGKLPDSRKYRSIIWRIYYQVTTGWSRRNYLGIDWMMRRKAKGSVFGPAELGEGLLEAGKRQANDVEVAAFDAGNVAAGAALDAIGAGFVVRLAGGEISGDFLGGESSEVHERGLHKGAALDVGKADEGDTGDDGVRAAGKLFQHAARVVGRERLAKDVAVEGDLGVRGDDDGWANGAGGDEVRLGVSQALNEIVRGFARVRRFVDGGGKHREMEPSIAKNPGAARRSGSENELHAGGQ